MGILFSLFTREEQLKLTVTKEDSTTEYHTNGTRTERKKVTTYTFTAPDAETFKTQLLSGVKSIEFY